MSRLSGGPAMGTLPLSHKQNCLPNVHIIREVYPLESLDVLFIFALLLSAFCLLAMHSVCSKKHLVILQYVLV